MNKIIVIGFAFLNFFVSNFVILGCMDNFLDFSTGVVFAQQKTNDVDEAVDKHFRLGYSFLTSKKYDMAIKHFDEANKIHPSPVIFYLRGVALKFSKHYQAAIESFTKAIELGFDRLNSLKKEDIATLYTSRAFSYYYLGKISEFVYDIEKAIKLVPEFEKQHSFLLMDSYRMLGEYNEALKWADKIVETDGMTIQTLKDKLSILMKLGRFDECDKIVKQIEQINPTFRFLNLCFAELYIEKGDLDNAEKSLRECYNYSKKKIDEWEYYRLKSKIEFLRKDYNSALKDMDTQIRLIKNNKSLVIKTADGDIRLWHSVADSFKLRGDIYLAMENFEKALEDYQFFVSVSPHIVDKEEVKKKIVQLRKK